MNEHALNMGRIKTQLCFCQHPQRDAFERNIRLGLVEAELDADQSWAEGTAHRHMRRHAGEFHNNSNSECPVCTHPERANIEEAVLNHIVPIDAMADDLEITVDALSHHIQEHTQLTTEASCNRSNPSNDYYGSRCYATDRKKPSTAKHFV